MRKSIHLFLVLSFFISTVLVGQKSNLPQPELDSGSIEQQFDYIITKSSKFRDFQLIRKASILKVKAHTLDSIRTVRNDLISANKSVAQIEGTIGQLKSEVQTLKDEIETISKNVDSISLFGIPLGKSTYNTIVWSIIVVLLLGLLFFIAQFKKSSVVTKRSNNKLEKLGNEFDAFRKNALKKEQETMRKLQDEVNKNNP